MGGQRRHRSSNGRYLELREGGARTYEHRRVLGERIGRALLPSEIAHHVNEVKTDNRPENLWLFPDAASHSAWHGLLRRGGELRGEMPPCRLDPTRPGIYPCFTDRQERLFAA